MQRGSVPSVDSGSVHRFSKSPEAHIPRSKFNRSHGVKTTFSEGYLIPVLADEMLPGDTFNLRMTAFCRMSTPTFPIMDNLYLESFFFAVPYRLVWDNWEKFNGYQVNPGDSTDYTIPQVSTPPSPGTAYLSLADYMGVPVPLISKLINSLHFRAYNLIWNEWFRDENLQDSVVVQTDDGPDTWSNYVLLQRGKRHDYFTSCLPFPQKGPDVAIPLSATAPVIGNGVASQYSPIATPTSGPYNLENAGSGVYAAFTGYSSASTMVFSTKAGATTGLVADTSTLGGTIDALRLAFQTQKLYERDARGGTRYTEIIRAHFGVTSPDMRLQRPEYLGGGSTPILVNPVAQTSNDGTGALGVLGAYATCAPHGHGFTYSATEHMLILGMVMVRADINYQQGLERMWSRQTRFDYYWPALSHIGEQAVLNQEIYAQGNSDDELVFGYQERFAEYRYKPSQITGAFRSGYPTTLDAWHLAQDFGSLPVLNAEFIVEDAPMSRILALDTTDQFLFDCFFSYSCARPMPVYAVPGLVDHF